jgi:nucleoside-diphosphate-sugar epimerase
MITSRVVILGGAGFLGTRLAARLLRRGDVEVVLADIQRSSAYPDLSQLCDVRTVESVRAVCRGADIIYNLAAEHRDDVRPVERYHEVNVGGAEVVCQVAHELGIRTVIFTSSVAVYGLPTQELDESATPAPFNEYGRTKLLAEAVYRRWANAGPDRSLIIVRPTVIFGEGNRGNVYHLLRQIASGTFVMIGSGKNKKSMAYVENVAAFLEHLSDIGPGIRLLNYVDKPDFDMETLVRLVSLHVGRRGLARLRLPFPIGYSVAGFFDLAAAMTRRSLPISRVRVRKFCSNTMFSADAASRTGFSAPVPLREALKRTLHSDFGRTG